MERLNQIKDQITAPFAQSQETLTSKKSDDVVIISAYRTPITKGGKGYFKDVKSDELLYRFLVEFLAKLPSDFNPGKIGDVSVGNVLNKGAGATEFRAACLAAGIPYSTPFSVINRQCSSSLTTVNDIANKIKVGQIEVGLALGIESMSQFYGPGAIADISDVLKKDKEAAKCGIPMGITNENIAAKYTLSREDQDKFAAESYQKAEKALKQGLFKEEILPITIDSYKEDPDDEDEKPQKVTVDTDGGPRANVTAQSLGKIRAAFKKDGTTTAGNSSQVSDGASGVLLAKRSTAEKLGLPIIGKYIDFVAVGVPPEIMGVGPGYAIPELLTKNGVNVSDVAVFEINEAFAGQAIWSINKVGIDYNKVNPRGGAIALGHPLGATGGRQVATIMRELKTGEIGVTSMCIGTGMGAAALFVKE
ncbi:hypothetical protein WICPIJ_002214 [Wickerhamomyces pijperi]|uniref:acetyl-CoA C-acyltransferase n=1 Tax=Wickerhamomyces pijperi TaxID=599730 RepID=A0A9P8QC54_WICPI|nr:hypothetical protein WICPIJ_002214 [Wickerhamomyces pijperi]